MLQDDPQTPDANEAGPRASIDYFRKLNQQLVQKDSIIKLLQLKVKDLEANRVAKLQRAGEAAMSELEEVSAGVKSVDFQADSADLPEDDLDVQADPPGGVDPYDQSIRTGSSSFDLTHALPFAPQEHRSGRAPVAAGAPILSSPSHGTDPGGTASSQNLLEVNQTQRTLIDALKGRLVEMADELALVEARERSYKITGTDGQIDSVADSLRSATDSIPSEGGRLIIEELQSRVDRLTAALASRDRQVQDLEKLARISPPEAIAPATIEVSPATRHAVATIEDPLLAEEFIRKDSELNRARKEITELKDRLVRLESGQAREKRLRSDEAPAAALSRGVLGALAGYLAETSRMKEWLPVELRGRWIELEGRLDDLVERLHLERIDTVGRSYDPEVHHAGEWLHLADQPHNLILREITPGFRAPDWVRMAEVAVNRNPNYCAACDDLASDGSKFCNQCGGRVLGGPRENSASVRPAMAQSHLELGLKFENARDYGTARVHLEKSLDLDPASSAALEGMARLSEKEGRYVEALELIGRIDEQTRDPAHVDRWKRRIHLKVEILDRLVELD